MEKLRSKIRSLTTDPYAISLCIILLFGFFFRFFNIPKRYGFDYDAARDSLLAFFAATHLKFPLVGPPTSVGELTFGPWYYYQLIFARLITQYTYAAWLSIGILSFLTIIITYKSLSVLENKLLGFIGAILVSFATSQVVLSTTLSNPSVIPFFVSTVIFFGVLYYKSKIKWYFVLLWGFIYAVGTTNHYQMSTYLILPLLLFLQNRKKGGMQDLVYFIVGAGIACLPIIIYDVTHNWYTFKGIINYLLHGRVNPNYIPTRWVTYIIEFWPQFIAYTLSLPLIVSVLCVLTGLGVVVYGIYTKHNRFFLLILILIFFLNVIYLRYYKGERAIYYLYYLQPLLFIFASYAIWIFSRIRYGFMLVLLCLISTATVMTLQNIRYLKPVDSHIAYTKYSNEFKKTYNNNMTIYNCGPHQRARVYALALLLEEENRLTTTGKKLGLYDGGCKKDKEGNFGWYVLQNDYTISYRPLKIKTDLGELTVLDLDKYTMRSLSAQNWNYINSEVVYNNITSVVSNK